MNFTILKRVTMIKIITPVMLKPIVKNWQKIAAKQRTPEKISMKQLKKQKLHVTPVGILTCGAPITQKTVTKNNGENDENDENEKTDDGDGKNQNEKK